MAALTRKKELQQKRQRECAAGPCDLAEVFFVVDLCRRAPSDKGLQYFLSLLNMSR